MIADRKPIIAIDFDGTITEGSPYPITGNIRDKAVEVIKRLQQRYTCILWTCRSGADLYEAITLLNKHGIEFEYVNKSPIDTGSNKVLADIYIDDRNFNSTVNWDEIEKLLLTAL